MHDDSAGALRPSLASFLLALNHALSAEAAGVAGGMTTSSAMGTGFVPTIAANYSIVGVDAPTTCGSHHHFGMENMSACGVDSVLCGLLCIVAGFCPFDDVVLLVVIPPPRRDNTPNICTVTTTIGCDHLHVDFFVALLVVFVHGAYFVTMIVECRRIEGQI